MIMQHFLKELLKTWSTFAVIEQTLNINCELWWTCIWMCHSRCCQHGPSLNRLWILIVKHHEHAVCFEWDTQDVVNMHHHSTFYEYSSQNMMNMQHDLNGLLKMLSTCTIIEQTLNIHRKTWWTCSVFWMGYPRRCQHVPWLNRLWILIAKHDDHAACFEWATQDVVNMCRHGTDFKHSSWNMTNMQCVLNGLLKTLSAWMVIEQTLNFHRETRWTCSMFWMAYTRRCPHVPSWNRLWIFIAKHDEHAACFEWGHSRRCQHAPPLNRLEIFIAKHDREVERRVPAHRRRQKNVTRQADRGGLCLSEIDRSVLINRPWQSYDLGSQSVILICSCFWQSVMAGNFEI